MKLTFDHYHNLERVELYLCNPDGRELFPLPGEKRSVVLRFNDLSSLTFDVGSEVRLSDGTTTRLEAYDYIQTRRLVFATNIGYFQIMSVDEHDDGSVKYKSVSAESLQSVFKNKGFYSEDRVYCFYDPLDPYDDNYDASAIGAIPSVLGQMKKQLGIQQDLAQGRKEPDAPYEDWTVTYIHPSLKYSGKGSICRTFSENITYGYDWIVNDVEKAFEVVILFDFLYRTIQVLIPEEVTQKANVIYTFNNFMKTVDVNENSNDIVTVLNCNGNNCDIRAVNPSGTNYICDFSYFMDKTNYRWMSPELISKIEEWENACDLEKGRYESLVQELKGLYEDETKKKTQLQEMSVFLTDLKNAQGNRSVLGSETPGSLCGIVMAESVKSRKQIVNGIEVVDGGKSIKPGSGFHDTVFVGSENITAYQHAPEYNTETGQWDWVSAGESMSGSADSIIAHNLSDENKGGVSYWYFSDEESGESYCKLNSAVIVNDGVSEYYCGGFDRYIACVYPVIDEETGSTVYTDKVQEWIDLRESHVTTLNTQLYGSGSPKFDENGVVIDPSPESVCGRINNRNDEIIAISKRLNILSYFSDTPKLFRELGCYWIEGDYTNENIAVLDDTPLEEEVDLANELLEAGRIELSKVCQPRYSFSITSSDATKQYEFREQMRELELGKIVTVEKEEGVWFYPALLEISMSLDDSDSFGMVFANSMRLDDWGYTYADLISDASSTSRKVSANWNDILSYSKERKSIVSMVKNPLDLTLRAASANAVNQEISIDQSGILGRKKTSASSNEFEDEQVRLINNLLIFTDDNWQTAKTALGKIYYDEVQDDGSVRTVSSYGLIAETIIGSLIMGEHMKIQNPDSTVEIGKDGIVIKNADGNEVFAAKPDGTLVVRNYTTNEQLNTTLEGYTTTAKLESEIKLLNDSISLRVTSDTFTATLEGYATTEKLESEVKLLNNSISLRVTSDTFNTTLEGYATTEKLESEVKLLNNSISLRVTSDKLSETLEDYATTESVKSAIELAETGINMYVTSDAMTQTLEGYATTESVKSAIKLADEGISAYVTSETLTDSLGDYAKTTELEKYVQTSELDVVKDSINAKVSETCGDQTSSFGWSLKSGGFYVYSGGSIAMQITKDGLVVSGKIVADEGSIGGFGIASDCIYSGLTMSTSVTGRVEGVDTGSVLISTEAKTCGKTIGGRGTAGTQWRLIIGTQFGVTGHGVIYASGAKISGAIDVQSGGKIGSLTVTASGVGVGCDDDYSFSGGSFMTGTKIGADKCVFGDGGVINGWTFGNYGIAGCYKILNTGAINYGIFSTAHSGVSYSRFMPDKIYVKRTTASLITTERTATWFDVANTAGNSTSTSDARVKNSIECLPDSYERFFDMLSPKRYKYNNGTSGRYHTGYIAQEVVKSLEEAGLSTSDFAAVMLKDPGTEAECWELRRDEFVSLNTWQIQKLKARVAQLEDILKGLTQS